MPGFNFLLKEKRGCSSKPFRRRYGPMGEGAALCKECNYRSEENECRRRSGCVFIPAIIRLEKFLLA
jgi:hypothetical protein